MTEAALESSVEDTFASGLVESGAPTATPGVTDETAQVEGQATTEEVAPEPEPAQYMQLTKEEWDQTLESHAAIRRQLDKAFGHIGAFDQKLAKLLTETPAGEPLKASAEDFSELKQEYPDLAELTLNGLNRLLGRFKGTAPDIDQIMEKMQPGIRQQIDQARELAMDTLEVAHPDWQKDVATPEFGKWIKSQRGWHDSLENNDQRDAQLQDPESGLRKWMAANPDEPVTLFLSPRVSDASRMLRLYKAAKPAPRAPVPPKARHLTAAVVPRGDGAATKPTRTAHDYFQEGLRDTD